MPTKQESIYARLRSLILDGTYGPGYRLVLGSLAEEFETSPIPVREAIRRLEAEGYVRYEENRGARVAPVDPEGFTEAFYTLACLEGTATALAASRLDTEDVGELRRLNREMMLTLESFDVLGYAALNRSFHRLFYDRCPNVYLRDAILRIERDLDLMRRTVFTVVPGRSRESVREHDRMLRMILERAGPDALELEARQHKLRTLEAFLAWEAKKSGGEGARGAVYKEGIR